jgi:hypothetical protein
MLNTSLSSVGYVANVKTPLENFVKYSYNAEFFSVILQAFIFKIREGMDLYVVLVTLKVCAEGFSAEFTLRFKTLKGKK